MEGIAYELNQAGAALAREAAAQAQKEDGRRRFVAGALGPTNRTASISPDVANPGFRAITFDRLRTAYSEQTRGLIDGGADLLLIETIFDTLNAKAAIFAISEICEERGLDIPVMVSGTITDRSGRLLSGQTPGGFWNSVQHVLLFAPASTFTAHTLLHDKLPYDPKELVPIARVTNTLIALGVPSDLNVSSVKELAAKIKSEPGKLNYASVTGANDLLFAAWLKTEKLDMTRPGFWCFATSSPKSTILWPHWPLYRRTWPGLSRY